MATVQEIIESFATLSSNDQKYFFSRLNPENQAFKDYSTEQFKTTKDRLYEEIKDLKKTRSESESTITALEEQLKTLKEGSVGEMRKEEVEQLLSERLQEFSTSLNDRFKQGEDAFTLASTTYKDILRQRVFSRDECKVPEAFRRFVEGDTEEELINSAKEVYALAQAYKQELVPQGGTEGEAGAGQGGGTQGGKGGTQGQQQGAQGQAAGAGAGALNPLEVKGAAEGLNPLGAALGAGAGSVEDFSYEDLENMSQEDWEKNRAQIKQQQKRRLEANSRLNT